MRKRKIILLLLFTFSFLFIPLAAQAVAKSASLPLAAGYSVLGLHAAGKVMDFFTASQLYSLIALIGLTVLIFQGVTKKEWRPLVVYVVTLMVCVSLFILPRTKISSSDVFTHFNERGIELTKEQKEMLKSLITEEEKTPTGLLFSMEFTDRLVNGINDALNVTTGKKGELLGEGLPFANLLIRTHLQNIVISDDRLDAEYRKFCVTAWALAVVDWNEEIKSGYRERDPTKTPWWPGHPMLEPYYKKIGITGNKMIDAPWGEQEIATLDDTAWGWWLSLHSRLYKHFDGAIDPRVKEKRDQNTAGMTMDMAVEDSYKTIWGGTDYEPGSAEFVVYEEAIMADSPPAIIENALILKSLQNSEIDASHQMLETVADLQEEPPLLSDIGRNLARGAAWLTASFMYGALDAFPIIQAYVLYITLALFPVVLFMAFLPFPGQQGKVLFMYFLSVFWVKSWLWGFTLANNFQAVVWNLGSMASVGDLIPADTLIFFVIILLITITPVFTYGLIFKGGLTIATAAGAAVVSLAAGAQALLSKVVGTASSTAKKGVGMLKENNKMYKIE